MVAVDVHCHVGQLLRPMLGESRFSFEQGPWLSYISKPLIYRIPRPVFRSMLGVDFSAGVDTINAAIERFLLRHMLNTPSVDRLIVLAFDAVHADDGRAQGPARTTDRPGTHLYVSNTYVHTMCEQHPNKFWFGASVHPYRPDALRALDEVAAAGAVLIKWLPPAQNIDVTDPRSIAFLRHAGRIGMPLLIHGGGEATLPCPSRRYSNALPLLDALRTVRNDGPLPPIIVAHAATPSFLPFGRSGMFDTFIKALQTEFADAPLYVDLAGMATPPRARWLTHLLARPELHHKLVYGSDFPIRVFPLFFAHKIGLDGLRAARCESWLESDAVLKQRLGTPRHVFTRMSEILTAVGRHPAV